MCTLFPMMSREYLSPSHCQNHRHCYRHWWGGWCTRGVEVNKPIQPCEFILRFSLIPSSVRPRPWAYRSTEIVQNIQLRQTPFSQYTHWCPKKLQIINIGYNASSYIRSPGFPIGTGFNYRPTLCSSRTHYNLKRKYQINITNFWGVFCMSDVYIATLPLNC